MKARELLALFRRAAPRACLVVGPCFLALALGFAIHTFLFLNDSVATDGTVVGLAPIRNSETDSITVAPIINFTSGDGQTYTVTSDVASDPPEFSVGQRTKVLYEKGDPAGAKLATFRQLWWFPAIFAFLGFICSGIGYGLLQYERRRNRQGFPIGA